MFSVTKTSYRIKMDKNIVGFIGEFAWKKWYIEEKDEEPNCVDAAFVFFDKKVVNDRLNNKNNYKEKDLQEEEFIEQFQMDEIGAIRIEQFRKKDNKEHRYRVYVRKPGLRLEERKEDTDTQDDYDIERNNGDDKANESIGDVKRIRYKYNFKRNVIGKNLYLEEDFFDELYEEYYKNDYHEKYDKNDPQNRVTINGKDGYLHYYKLPIIKDYKAIISDFIKKYDKDKEEIEGYNEDFFNALYLPISKYLGGFYQSLDRDSLKESYNRFLEEIEIKDKVDVEKDNYILLNGHLFEFDNKNYTHYKLIEKRYEKSISEDVFYIYKDKIIDSQIDNTTIEELIKIFLNKYPKYKNKNLVEMSISEQWTLERELNDFMPDNCNKSWRDWLLNRITRAKVLGIDENLFSPYDEKKGLAIIFNDYKNKAMKIPKELPTLKEGPPIQENLSLLYAAPLILNEDLANLFISISLYPITVITGRAGTLSGEICRSLHKNLKISYEDEERSLKDDRFRIIPASSSWKDGDTFIKSLEDENEFSYNIWEYLSYEAEYMKDKNNKEIADIPYIMCIMNATAADVEKYLEDFTDLRKFWYKDKKSKRLGNTHYKIPKNFRIILQIEDSFEGTLSKEFLELVNVVEPLDPESLCKRLKEGNHSLGSYFKGFSPENNNEDSSSFYEIPWKLYLREEYYESLPFYDYELDIYNMITNTYEKLCEKIEGSVRINERRISISTKRMENAVKRHFNKMSMVMDKENKPRRREEVESLIPGSLIIDEKYLPVGEERKNHIIALDYAIAQHILPCITKAKGIVTLSNPSELVEFLLENKLYLCVELLLKALNYERIIIADELTEKFNDEYIIKKCEEKYSELLRSVSKKAEDDDPKDLLDQICHNINLYRDKKTYTRNVIANMLICITQGFITIFSGKPGCGKTSICRLLGKVLGLSNEKVEYGSFKDRRNEDVYPARYIEVSTERGWTSKRDFIGYYNPLTEQFDKVNALLYNAFLVMDNETKTDARAEISNEQSMVPNDEGLPPFEDANDVACGYPDDEGLPFADTNDVGCTHPDDEGLPFEDANNVICGHPDDEGLPFADTNDVDRTHPDDEGLPFEDANNVTCGHPDDEGLPFEEDIDSHSQVYCSPKPVEEHLPFLILLDEANLSPMEYYWADFMNLCEAWSKNNSIDLGGGRIFKIPEGLHFVATINNDHTTEVLSPRLIDRASVIDLPLREDGSPSDGEENIRPVTWSELKDTFSCNDMDDKQAEAAFKEKADEQYIDGGNKNSIHFVYKEIKDFVQDYFMVSISPRTDIAVAKYWLKAKDLFENQTYYVKTVICPVENLDSLNDLEPDKLKENLAAAIIFTEKEGYNKYEVPKHTQAIDYAIAQRILPKLTDVNGEAGLKHLKELMSKLLGYKLYKSAGIIADMILRGCDSRFYNFFR